jgi:putative ABC transport system ATP-binding protein
MKCLELSKVSRSYGIGAAQVHALQEISLSVEAGEFTVFAGSSGSGKTTLLNLIGGLDKPTRGTVQLIGKNLATATSRELADLRRKELGFVFQTFNLLPVLTAEENVAYPLLRLRLGTRELKDRCAKALDRVGLGRFSSHRPDQLSGGQRQRVAIARAIVHRPLLILADEPTANLDKKNAIEILNLMRELNVESGVTFIFSTHDALIIQAARRVIQLSDGRIITDVTSR